MCHKWYFWHILNSFPNRALTVFRHISKNWRISDSFPNLFWLSSDRYLCLTVFWLISDTFMTVFWHIFVTDSFLTDFWQICDTFWKLLGPTLNKSTEECVRFERRLRLLRRKMEWVEAAPPPERGRGAAAAWLSGAEAATAPQNAR